MGRWNLDVRRVGIDLKLLQCIQNTNGSKFSLIVIIKYSIIVQWKIFHSLITSYYYLLTWLKTRILILKCKKKDWLKIIPNGYER